jgi:hypothetical protein
VSQPQRATAIKPFSYPEPFLRAVRREALAKSISELASDWLVLTQDIVFLPCFHGIRLWIWPEPRAARKKGSGYENAIKPASFRQFFPVRCEITSNLFTLSIFDD